MRKFKPRAFWVGWTGERLKNVWLYNLCHKQKNVTAHKTDNYNVITFRKWWIARTENKAPFIARHTHNLTATSDFDKVHWTRITLMVGPNPPWSLAHVILQWWNTWRLIHSPVMKHVTSDSQYDTWAVTLLPAWLCKWPSHSTMTGV